MGRRYTFEPDQYRKGNATREPADIAWFCLDTAVLMYMKSGGSGWASDAEANIRQARGWMRAWRGGQNLTGTSDEDVFDVAYTRSLAVLVLLISADPALNEIVVHDEWASELGVDLCVTISERLVEGVAGSSMGVADLASLIRNWAKNKAAGKTLTDFEMLEGYVYRNTELAWKLAGWIPNEKSERDLKHFDFMLKDFRTVTSGRNVMGAQVPNRFTHRGPDHPETPKEVELEPNRLFSDLRLFEHGHVLFTLGRMAELVREGMPHMTSVINVGGCTLVLHVVSEKSFFPDRLISLHPPKFDLAMVFMLEHQIIPMAFSREKVEARTQAWCELRSGYAYRKALPTPWLEPISTTVDAPPSEPVVEGASDDGLRADSTPLSVRFAILNLGQFFAANSTALVLRRFVSDPRGWRSAHVSTRTR
jgi:hypothetical protein